MNPHGLRKTSSPKFVVPPHVSEQESGSASRPAAEPRGVVDAPAGRQLHHKVGRLADRRHAVSKSRQVERGSMIGVADVDVDQSRAGSLTTRSRLHELSQSGRQRGDIFLGGLAPVGATVMSVPTEVMRQ